MMPTKEQIKQAIADRLTRRQAADRFGCSPDTVRRHAKKCGIRWPHWARFQPVVREWVNGESLTLRQAADRYGLHPSTVYWRHAHGWRGDDLVLPAAHDTRPQPFYETEYTGEDWREIIAFAKQRNIKAAAKCFGVPYGAVTAAMRGEAHRLG